MSEPTATTSATATLTWPRPRTRRERLVGRITILCLRYLTRAATRRGDEHERDHCLAALRAGDTSTRTHIEPCLARSVLLLPGHRAAGPYG